MAIYNTIVNIKYNLGMRCSDDGKYWNPLYACINLTCVESGNIFT